MAAQQSLLNFFSSSTPKRQKCDCDKDDEYEDIEQDEEIEDSVESGSESDVLCPYECCQDADGNPTQIKDAFVISNTRSLQGKKYRQFSIEWYKHRTWLILCKSRLKAFCSQCRLAEKQGLLSEGRRGGGDSFLKQGFNNWKKALHSFSQHVESAMHKEAVLKLNLRKQPSVVLQLKTQLKTDQSIHREMLLKQLSSIRYLLRQGLALRGHDDLEGNLQQLLLLRSEDCSALKDWMQSKKYLSPEIVNEQISLMAGQVLRNLLQEIREALFFSLIVDEATDSSNKEQVCISLRWVDCTLAIHEAPISPSVYKRRKKLLSLCTA